MKIRFSLLFITVVLLQTNYYASDSTKNAELKHIKTISGKIAPKSITHNGSGLFFAQNMMYRHTITVYNREYELVKTIKDKILLSKYDDDTSYHSKEYHRGAPVECVFTHDGKYAWVSNYEMSGKGFDNPGCDNCRSKDEYDPSYVYKINTETFQIENAIKVGSVPKYLASSNDSKVVLVSNWTSGDLSIISTETNTEIKRIKIGRFPRGITIDNQRNFAYVAVMGGDEIVQINLSDFSKTYFEVGDHPRHLCIDEADNILYATLNGEGKIAKIDLATHKIEKLRTGRLPRSMDYCDYNKTLYVVNYGSKYLSKIDATSFTVKDTIETNSKPIGVTIDKETGEIWVACYSGSIMIIKDQNYLIKPKMGPFVMNYEFKKPKDKKPLKIKPRVIRTESKTTNQFHVIVGSFKEKSNAIKLSKKLKKDYPNCSFFKNEKGFYYVSVKGFNSKDNAIEFMDREKSKSTNFSGWILKN